MKAPDPRAMGRWFAAALFAAVAVTVLSVLGILAFGLLRALARLVS